MPDDDPRFSDERIEELALRVDTCFAVIETYLIDRKNDLPSTISSEKKDIQRWRENSRNQPTDSTLSNLYVQQSQTNGTEHNQQTTLQDEAITQTDEESLSMPSPSKVAIQNRETIEAHAVTNQTAVSKLTNSNGTFSPIKSTRFFLSTYYSQNNEITPKLQGELNYSYHSKNQINNCTIQTIQTTILTYH